MNISLPAAALLVAAPLFAQPVGAQDETLGAQLEIKNGHLYAECSFDDQKRSCLVDTGAMLSQVSNTDDSFKDYPSVGKITRRGMSGSESSADLIRINRMVFGNAKLDALDIVRGQRDIIGMDAFGWRTLKFLFGEWSALILGELEPTEGVQAGLKRYPSGHFSIPLQIGKTSTQGLWETGSALTVIDTQYYNQHENEFGSMQAREAHDSVGRKMEIKTGTIHRMNIGGQEFNEVNVIVSDLSAIKEVSPGVDVLIGFDLIVKANWFFDLYAGHWAIHVPAP